MNAALINPFTNAVASPPVAADTAGALPQPPSASAGPSVSDGVGAKPILASSPSEAATVSGRAPVAAEIHSSMVHNAVTQALEIRTGSIVSCDPKLPAVSNSPAQETAGSFGNELEQLIGVAGKRRRSPLALPRFVPDKESLWDAMHDPSARRVRLDIAGDPVWADESPLFLQTAR